MDLAQPVQRIPMTEGPDPDPLWRAVVERDASFEGALVYAVKTTGVYCRPTCPSRRPKRTNTLLFPSGGEARAAGFRPCRRCQPDAAPAPDPMARKVLAACREIERSEGRPTLAELGRAVDASPHHLQRSFQRLLGVTPRQYADARRVARLKRGLRAGRGVARALYSAGYGSTSRLYESAPAALGMTPAAYQRGGLGERIRFAHVHSPLGWLLVAATERGICKLAFGGSPEELCAELDREFPGAELEPADAELETGIADLVRALAGERPWPALPINVAATAFQRRVWEALRAIPVGSTRSYGELARAIGQPGASRAVARACATNPVPLLIPCHRAVRGDGHAGGYRYGPERKRMLLELEATESLLENTPKKGDPKQPPASGALGDARNEAKPSEERVGELRPPRARRTRLTPACRAGSRSPDRTARSTRSAPDR
jgi:AraC family transcriptional regulator of adaptative response/methylated-DNA-[protein]-cysteine methyltransferase